MSAEKIFQKIFIWCKKEIVFCVTFLLALISTFFVKPDAKYISYIDFGTLLTLFSLMAVVAGWRRTGLFDALGKTVCRKVHGQRALCLTLVLLCFFTSMVITNDVALLTFVPFAVVLLSKTDSFVLLYTVVLQTLAANLGSMITPIGNPQNIFLFSKMQLGTVRFMKILFPYTLLSLALLILSTLIIKNEKIQIERQETESGKSGCKEKNILYTALFILCLLSVVNVIPKWAVAVLVALCVLVSDRKIFCNIDFMLLLTFTAFFIFTGNIARLESVDSFLKRITGGNEFAVSLAFSQVISNVPATLLLHPFAQDTKELLLGVDIGGLGTPVASLASLISLKLYTQEKGGTAKFLTVFTLMNIIFLAILCAMKVILQGL
ncbi:SLC13 family permease [uncultured Treponema sp.]|mgnify:FL=1|uniref:SLC13 family permease n=1 Tax=uncultured Treponema sp. TaxID=162155 RepID=UPI00260A3E11|nr:SLC13 family permease [uncultured Treponema sp.]